MKIAVIGYHKNLGCGSYAHRIAEVLDKEHEVYRITTSHLPGMDIEGYRLLWRISDLLKGKTPDYIIVIQSHILITNDTKIPLLLLKTERNDPPGTVENPTYFFKKLEVMNDLQKYKFIIFPSIDLARYDIDVEKDLLLSDQQWSPQKFDDYINIVERSQHTIIFQRVHETDCITTRVLEAMACKTIPIIFYKTPDLIKLYGLMGIGKDNAYFVCTREPFNLEIKEYDKEMAQRGYDLVQEKYGTEVMAKNMMEMFKNGKK